MPYESDFVSPWGTTTVAEMYDARHCSSATAARKEALAAGYSWFLAPKESRHGTRLYRARATRVRAMCVNAEMINRVQSFERQQEKFNSDKLEVRMAQKVKNALARIKKKCADKAMPYDLTFEAIFPRVLRGVCEATGLPLKLDTKRRTPYSYSFDQRIAGAGYTLDNVQIVCSSYNALKSNFPDEEVQDWLAALVRKCLEHRAAA